MTRYPSPALPIARLLFSTHFIFLLGVWVVLLLLMGLVIVGLDTFRTVDSSIWDLSLQLLRLAVVFYGVHFTKDLLPLYVSHGQTRREFMIQTALFFVVGIAGFAALMTFGYVLETWLYSAMGWPQLVSGQLLFDAPNQYAMIFLTYWIHLLGFMVIGALVAAGFYRSDGWGAGMLFLAIVILLMVVFSTGGNDLPLISRFLPRSTLSLPLTILPGVAAITFAFALLWATIRDIPIRQQPI